MAGREIRFDRLVRRYGFDPEGCRLVDRWWPVDDEPGGTGQSLRCYTPAELRLLLRRTGLRLESVEPRGGIDPTSGEYRDRVVLGDAMSYVAEIARG